MKCDRPKCEFERSIARDIVSRRCTLDLAVQYIPGMLLQINYYTNINISTQRCYIRRGIQI